MKKEDFIKKLDELKVPEVEVQSHKKQLKMVLFQKQFGDHQIKRPFFSAYFKKVVALGLISVFLLTVLFVQNRQSAVQTVSAKEIVSQAIMNVRNLSIQSEKTNTLLAALEAAENAHDLQYLGEENFGGRLVRKLRFSDENISSDIVVRVAIGDTSDQAVSIGFSTDYIPYENVSGDIRNGEIVQPDILRQQLSDKNIQKDWMKALIREQNLKTFNTLHPPAFLKPYFESADVLISGYSFEPDKNGLPKSYNLQVYVLSHQKQNVSQATAILDEAIKKMRHFTSADAAAKLALLEKARRSGDLKYYPEEDISPSPEAKNIRQLTFIDPSLRSQEIWITIDLQDLSENQVRFDSSLTLGMGNSVIEGTFVNGVPANLDAFQEKVLDQHPQKDLILQTIIRPQNKRAYEQLAADPNTRQDFLKLMKPIYDSSEFFLPDLPYYSKDANGNINGFAIGVSSFEPENDFASLSNIVEGAKKNTLINGWIQQMSGFNTPAAKGKIELLEKVREAKQLIYAVRWLIPDAAGQYYSIIKQENEQQLPRKIISNYSVAVPNEKGSLPLTIAVDNDLTSDHHIDFEFGFHDFQQQSVLEGVVRDGKIVNSGDLLKQLQTLSQLNPQDNFFPPVVKASNELWMQQQHVINQTDDGQTVDAQQFRDFKNQLTPLIEQSPLLIDGIIPEMKGKKGELSGFTLRVYYPLLLDKNGTEIYVNNMRQAPAQ